MSFLSNLEWRYATKKFDTTKKVSEENLSKILEAIRMTPTWYGLQPYHFFVITSPEKLEAIKGAAYGQEQITTASHLLILCARNDLTTLKEEYLDDIADGNAEVRAGLAGFDEALTGFIGHASPSWSREQTFLAAGFGLAAAAELEIDSCPMGGFDPAKVAEILELPQHMSVAVLLPIGYRDSSDQPRGKVRFSIEQLFTRID